MLAVISVLGYSDKDEGKKKKIILHIIMLQFKAVFMYLNTLILFRPDVTKMVDWALKNNYLP